MYGYARSSSRVSRRIFLASFEFINKKKNGLPRVAGQAVHVIQQNVYFFLLLVLVFFDFAFFAMCPPLARIEAPASCYLNLILHCKKDFARGNAYVIAFFLFSAAQATALQHFLDKLWTVF